MPDKKVFDVVITLAEDEDFTNAQARLYVGDAKYVGWGRARRNPADPSVPRIGEELAVGRALSELAHRLVEAAAEEISEREGRPAHLYA